jgi:nitroreductase
MEVHTMETLTAIRERKSIRAFLPKPVSRERIAQVLEASRWAPSGSNRQPWRVTVATGEHCRALAERLVARCRERQPGLPGVDGDAADLDDPAAALRADLRSLAARMGQSLWEFVVAGSYALYDAPVVIVVTNPGERGGDVSPFVTTMLLAAHDLGLGTCWLGYPVGEGELIREMLGIPDGERVRAVVALGYPDPDATANAYRSPRQALTSLVRWVGFD